MARAIMIQGAGSNVGKSMLVAGIARACLRRGMSVAPFKPQNMSNNAAVTVDGGEIGRAQALQARAAGRAPHSDMNPVLLKPENETGAQIVLQGRAIGRSEAKAYGTRKAELLRAVLESFARLARSADLILVEGAGSPAEINLRAGDIANMGFAEAARVPVVLVGDIDRGGVIAQVVGTQAVLDPADAALIRAFAINKFRGDTALFADGLRAIEARTGWPSLGVVPWFPDAWRLPAEDALDIVERPGGEMIVAVPRLGRIANFDDLDPLSAEPGVSVRMIEPGRPLPGDARLVLIPGSKSTIADLAAFRANGWDIDLAAHVRRGGAVLGLCGGYQMLGRSVSDPGGVEGPACTVPGLGLLDVETVMHANKRVTEAHGRHVASGAEITGYEIHMGRTQGPDCARAWLEIGGVPEGAASADGLIRGSYVHGLLSSDEFRAAYLSDLGCASTTRFERGVDAALDALADHLEAHLDIDRLLSLAADIG
ncbi:cobyric acid synthase [Roseovarius aquimarinus]|uniref:Cobyric acid synthase n=1 Tax=Roseovarius aquimarinus TaxID=1229156 RepID=A0ABW7I7J7_9RHOB